jgi:hydrogenase nickel incorporation protein HypA/HybF
MEDYMKDNSLIKIEKLVLEVGELSEIYPKYLMDVYPMAVENTKLANTELVIETAPGIGKCKSCDFVYNLVENDNTCPLCSSKEFIVISGRDFLIKELHAY